MEQGQIQTLEGEEWLHKDRESLAKERLARIEKRRLMSLPPVAWMNEFTSAEYDIVPEVVKQFATIPYISERDYETQ